MKIHTIIELHQNRWMAQVGLFPEKPLTLLELENLSLAGSPLVNVGGEFTETITTPPVDPEGEPTVEVFTFTLPDSLYRFPDDFPVKRSFDLGDYADAKRRVKLWADTIATRMVDARDSVMNTDNTQATETVVTV